MSHECRLEAALAEAGEPLRDGALRLLLHGGDERGAHLPVWRIVVVELRPKLLAEIVLGVPRAASVQPGGREDARRRGAGLLFGLRGDETLRAHARKHDMAALKSAIVVGPRPQPRRHANQTGDECRLGQRQFGGALAEDVARHGLDAIDRSAEVDAVEVQLQNLRLGQTLFDHHRENSLFAFSQKIARSRQKKRAGELLRERAAAFLEAPGTHIARDGAPDGDRVDAQMAVEAVIFDGDNRVAEIGGNAVQRNIAAMLLERKPRSAVRPVEHRLTDAARQLVYRKRVANHDATGDQRHQDSDRCNRQECVALQAARAAEH